MSTLDIKCVLVGDRFEDYTTSVRFDGHVINLKLFDTAGQEDYDRIRPLSYPHADVFLMCFPLNAPESFSNIKHKWYPEIKHHCPSSHIILVGNRLDCKNEIIQREGENSKKIITTNQGLALKKEIGARKYVECSALTGERVHRVFDEVVRAVIEPDPATF